MQHDPGKAKSIALLLQPITNPSDLDAALELHCGQDSNLRSQVCEILQATAGRSGSSRADNSTREGSTGTSDDSRGTIIDTRQAEFDRFSDNERIGSYRILHKLGEGGFGEVYHARQAEPVQRDVAIKIIKKGMDTREVLTRFQAESQALAMMDHPGIAKVFDVGTTDSGQPYFVMELVRGIPICRYCDLNQFTIRQRVELFVELCAAVQHAHQKGVIHRDLKPSNILVSTSGDRPRPVVIDFGVSKATQTEQSHSMVVTRIHQMLGTPAYMSPEQADFGVDIDTRADIYSLGVVLYELLSGELPVDRELFATRSSEKISQTILKTEFQRPSQRVAGADQEQRDSILKTRGESASSLAKSLRSELDWIAMKCLEKDRSQRYEAVYGLALDCVRYLNNEPVQAKRSTVMYGLRKFVAKNQALALATAAVFLALCIGLGISISLARMFQQQKADVFLLADLAKLQSIESEYDAVLNSDYWERPNALGSWIQRAKDVLNRREEHEAALSRLQTRQPEELDESQAWQYESQLELVSYLDWLDGDNGALSVAECLLLRSPTTEETDAQWAIFQKDIEKSHPTWHSNTFERLFPIGKNPETGLWEFVDLKTGFLPESFRGQPDAYTGIIYVLLPGGTYTMGSPENEIGRRNGEMAHPVQLSPFMMAKYETTQRIWHSLQNYRHFSNSFGDLMPAPASWFEARQFGLLVDAQLPSEAQWEYACRAGETTAYAEDLDAVAWHGGNSGGKLHNIGTKQANAFGLHDMLGNANEWCFDLYDPDFYSRSAALELDPSNAPSIIEYSAWNQLETRWANTPASVRAEEEEFLKCCLRGGQVKGKPHYYRFANRFGDKPNINIPAGSFRLVINDIVIDTELKSLKPNASEPRQKFSYRGMLAE